MPKPLRVTPFLLALVVLAAIAVGCDAVGTSPAAETPGPTGDAGLEGTDWSIEAVGGTTLAPDPPATLSVEPGGQVAGQTGCNQFNGTVSVDGAALTFGPLATTRKACEAGLMEQERAILDALAGVTGWSVAADGTLHLTGATELVLTPGAR